MEKDLDASSNIIVQSLSLDSPASSKGSLNNNTTYILNKWRFPGLIGLILYNLAAGLTSTWFGSISTQVTEDFHISVSQVNWLGNIINLVFLPASIAVPFMCTRYGLQKSCFGGAVLLILSGWIRFAGTPKSLSPASAYALLVLGQILAAISQPIFLVIGPRFSEAWFDFNGRTTATMVASIANPVGSALGQLLPSLLGTTRESILILAIISTAVFPVGFLIRDIPPTAPTFSGSIPPPPPMSTLRSLVGCPADGDRRFPLRAKLDFYLITLGFGIFCGAINAFSLLTAQIFEPYGYSATDSGLFGAVIILAGLVAAIVTSQLFDRVFTTRINSSTKTMAFFLGLSWVGLIWAVRAHNSGGIFAVMAAIGILSLALLPISLELACELIQDAEVSAAIMWDNANLLTVVFVLAEAALTDGHDASPPLNMHRALILTGAMCCAAGCMIAVCFRGLPDSRRAMDKAKEKDSNTITITNTNTVTAI